MINKPHPQKLVFKLGENTQAVYIVGTKEQPELHVFCERNLLSDNYWDYDSFDAEIIYGKKRIIGNFSLLESSMTLQETDVEYHFSINRYEKINHE